MRKQEIDDRISSAASGELTPDWHGRRLLVPICAALLLLAGASHVRAQCQGKLSSVDAAADCTARNNAPISKADIDPKKPYSLEELIDIAESNNPQTRIAWESAKQAAERLGMARSEYYPQLAALALAGDQREITPWPKPLGAPNGYFLLDASTLESGVELKYDVYDFGRRAGRVEASKALRLGTAAVFQRVNQDVAFRVVTGYFNLITAQERLEASHQIVKTAQTTQDAAEAQLANGRATLPDVLNARAAAAQARYDLEASIGGVDTARVVLRETIGVEPSDAILVEQPTGLPLPAEVAESTASLVDKAMQQRPDLRAISERLRAANAQLKIAKAEYLPTISFGASAGQQALWPSTNLPGPNQLGHANEAVWGVGVSAQWTIFDGGRRRDEVRMADSQRREAQHEIREKEDAIGREVWTAYVQFRTAVRQHEAAETLLTSANTSYDASLDAYKYGVKNLVDLVTAENQLAQARLAVVQSRSSVRINASNLDYTTGNLLRQQPPVAQPIVKKP
jgi:TolC family type I secretion outer membrane protein